MRKLIKGGTIVNDGSQYKADIILNDDRIEDIITSGGGTDEAAFDDVIDATGCIIMPGVIDTHVHFREPGLTHKADMESESRAAAYGGVTSVFDMPNTKPQTTTIEALEEKRRIAKEKMHVNYSFFPGATNDNIEELRKMDPSTIPGIKLFMGSSTGNMLVDKEAALDAVFSSARDMNLVLMAHCEDTETINRNMLHFKEQYGTDDPDVSLHPLIRSEEACVKSSSLAVSLARKHKTALHIAHVSTASELQLLSPDDGNITLEATVAHLFFSKEDYPTLGARIKCNPAIKEPSDRDALRKALSDEKNGIFTIGTDHAPHDISEKQGGAAKAMSGMPMVQFSLPAMLSLVDEGVLSTERMVALMCHNPARLFSVKERGFLRKGYKADITIVKRSDTPWTVTQDCIQSKCKWSPVEGRTFHWHIEKTICNGHLIYNKGVFDNHCHGEMIEFRREQK